MRKSLYRRIHFAYLSLFLCCSACSDNPFRAEGEQLGLNQTFKTRCEAFEAAAHYALERHLIYSPNDFEKLRALAVSDLTKDLEGTVPTQSTQNCADLDALRKEKSQEENLFYVNALKAFVGRLDPHSAYLPPDQAEEHTKSLKNEEFGLGIIFRIRLVDMWRPLNLLFIDQVFPNGPASNLLEEGDKISAVNGTGISGKTLGEIQEIISKEESVSVEIEGQKSVTVQKAAYRVIPVRAVTLAQDNVEVGYVQLRYFNQGVADLLRNEVERLDRGGGIVGFVLDLRRNIGGLLSEVAPAVDVFVDRGPVVYSRGGQNRERAQRLNIGLDKSYSAQTKGAVTSLPVVVIMDQYTASAGEIFAGALGQSGRAFLVGEPRTFGKWTGQIKFPLAPANGYGGMLVITMFRTFLFDESTWQGGGFPVHVPYPDPALAPFVAQRTAEGRPLILTEQDYANLGMNIVPALQPKSMRTQSAITKAIEEIGTLAQQPNCDWEHTDCQRSMAIHALSVLARIQPTWPSVSLSNN